MAKQQSARMQSIRKSRKDRAEDVPKCPEHGHPHMGWTAVPWGAPHRYKCGCLTGTFRTLTGFEED